MGKQLASCHQQHHKFHQLSRFLCYLGIISLNLSLLEGHGPRHPPMCRGKKAVRQGGLGCARRMQGPSRAQRGCACMEPQPSGAPGTTPHPSPHLQGCLSFPTAPLWIVSLGSCGWGQAALSCDKPLEGLSSAEPPQSSESHLHFHQHHTHCL